MLEGSTRSRPGAVHLEPTFSPAEVAEHFGLSLREVYRLTNYGRRYGADLHPTRGGLWPTYRITHKTVRIPLSALERHKRHIGRVTGITNPPTALVSG